eukprot:CAMPEP_0177364544 /NCGR_PEP_ID=MMETSP0368-20130122/38839_1 /TAXON_ID=447022 ORGANISM="Scrippsiella hangoei-like, Strain SHHI-4" /NCGR_SAMPLE_ID=MMETSP0368 /ASSEMBLY_ACC=CAM_ASM_000363 /LENGTH=86 /DNA_ID=CAMNT_0018827397 /DNA_START=592 /DNA_END=849 /DNA_ORIENTATION=-
MATPPCSCHEGNKRAMRGRRGGGPAPAPAQASEVELRARQPVKGLPTPDLHRATRGTPCMQAKGRHRRRPSVRGAGQKRRMENNGW